MSTLHLSIYPSIYILSVCLFYLPYTVSFVPLLFLLHLLLPRKHGALAFIFIVPFGIFPFFLSPSLLISSVYLHIFFEHLSLSLRLSLLFPRLPLTATSTFAACHLCRPRQLSMLPPRESYSRALMNYRLARLKPLSSSPTGTILCPSPPLPTPI